MTDSKKHQRTYKTKRHSLISPYATTRKLKVHADPSPEASQAKSNSVRRRGPLDSKSVNIPEVPVTFQSLSKYSSSSDDELTRPDKVPSPTFPESLKIAPTERSSESDELVLLL